MFKCNRGSVRWSVARLHCVLFEVFWRGFCFEKFRGCCCCCWWRMCFFCSFGNKTHNTLLRVVHLKCVCVALDCQWHWQSSQLYAVGFWALCRGVSCLALPLSFLLCPLLCGHSFWGFVFVVRCWLKVKHFSTSSVLHLYGRGLFFCLYFFLGKLQKHKQQAVERLWHLAVAVLFWSLPREREEQKVLLRYAWIAFFRFGMQFIVQRLNSATCHCIWGKKDV